ncbi:MAG: TIGR00159 family protein [Acidobacteria bacterium]|nr:TIGR00159 family protein [Acidobacteriota bacterium]
MDFFSTISLPNSLQQLHWRDLLDILIVFILVFEILKLLRGTRAVQILYGILFFTFLYVMSGYFQLQTVQVVVRNAVLYLGIAIIVVFQSEIRTALAHFGKNFRLPMLGFRTSKENKSSREFYDEIVLAATSLASEKIGALVIIERNVGLQDHINRGVKLDAVASYDLLVTIFNPNTPLHDGAIIIRNYRLAAASCFLPLTLNPRLAKDLGTRHRAAIGITEENDSIAVVVSEETGVISFVERGQIIRNLDSSRLRTMLMQALEPQKSTGRNRENSLTPELSKNPIDKSLAAAPTNKQAVFDAHPFVTKD